MNVAEKGLNLWWTLPGYGPITLAAREIGHTNLYVCKCESSLGPLCVKVIIPLGTGTYIWGVHGVAPGTNFPWHFNVEPDR